MIVIATKSTKRIIKGLRYKAVSLSNATSPIGKGSVEIENMGWYSANSFTTIDGEPLPSIRFNKPYVAPTLVGDDIKPNDRLVCITDSYKNFKNERIYEVERIDRLTTSYNYTRFKIKFKDISRSVYFNPYSFRKMTVDEVRREALNVFFDETDEDVEDNVCVNKNKELIMLLAKSILDKNRHHLSIVEWGIQQLSSNKILSSDYDILMDTKLKDILNILE